MPTNQRDTKPPSLRYLDVDSLLRHAPDRIAGRGRDYFRYGRVTVSEITDELASFTVRGSQWQPYGVDIWLDPDQPDRLIHAACNCPYAANDNTQWCKHKVAALLAMKQYFLVHKELTWADKLEPATGKPPVKREAKNILYFGIHRSSGDNVDVDAYIAPVELFDEAILNDKERIAEAILERRTAYPDQVLRRNQLTRLLNPSPSEIAGARMLAERWRNYSWNVSLGDILPLLVDSIVFHGDGHFNFNKRVHVLAERGIVGVVVDKTDDGIRLSASLRVGDVTVPVANDGAKVIGRSPMWCMADSMIFRVEDGADVVEIFARNPHVIIPSEDAGLFYEQFLPAMAQRAPVTGDVVENCQKIDAEPTPRLYLSENEGDLAAELRFGYGEIELSFSRNLPAESLKWDAERSRLVRVSRKPEAEENYRTMLSSHGLKRGAADGIAVLRQNVSVVDFLIHHIPKLAQAGFEVYGEEDIQSARVNRGRPKLSLSVSSGIDWFDISAVVSFDDLEVSLSEIRKALRKREKYVKLSDGSMGAIPEDWIDRYKHLFDMAEDTDEGIRLSKAQIMLLDSALEGADSSRVDDELDRRLSRLKDFSRIEPRPLPEGFVGELRHYQKVGYDWLHFLHDYEFGGCLADDMGIGKTVQALVLLQSLRESGDAKSASLIVMPRSLLGNWEREAGRFTPSMRVLVHADLDRGQDISEFDNYDLVITTYGIMLRDVDILSQYRFHYVILDESQAVKNPLCHTARAARQLACDHRLVLTGTPVENSTVELWSQFAFLNPGMLGSLDYFKKEFASPIERKQDAEAAAALRQLVYPFILRRTKELVAPELPPRTERVIYCDLEPDQRKLYNLQRDKYRALLLGMIEEAGMDKARMKVLEGLLRLRQVCNHPVLVDKTAKGDSAKMEVLIEMLETLVAENHKALVFSQFTQMLKLVRAELDKRGISYLYLDGHTKNRQELVDRFQNASEERFFLISLKAGGVGLNLTAADYVIHIDPWWNPAVERQASDRTHRIGQENPVFVNKLIARDSVEEKMLELQDRKRDLVDKLITTESSFFKSLTADDVRELFS